MAIEAFSRKVKLYDRNLARDILAKYDHLSDDEIKELLDGMVILELVHPYAEVADIHYTNVKNELRKQGIKVPLHGSYSFVISVEDYHYLELTASPVLDWCHPRNIKEHGIAQMLIDEINLFLR